MAELIKTAPEIEGGSGGRKVSKLEQRILEAFEKPLVLMLVVGSFLAVSTVFAKSAPSLGWHPLALLQWSILGGALGLFLATRLVGRARGARVREQNGSTHKQLLTYLVVTGLLFIAPNMIAVVAAPKVGAGFVSLCFAFPLVLTYAIAVALRLELLTVLMGSGVLLGVAGGVLLAVSGADLSADASLWSVIALLIPVFLAAGNIYRTWKWPKGARPVDLALGMMAVGFVALTLFTVAWGIPIVPASWTYPAVGLLVAQMTVFGLQYGLYFRLQQTAGPVYLSQIGSVAAVMGLGLGFLVFDEIPNEAKIAAVVFVAAGIVLVTLGRKRNMT
ncbi:MAG: DMT family transporter [Roseibium sp.]|uniref:DMT family transporter n=1 Tax=Roseibium sp. TaxID=1936156 RepID=UPI00262946AA|nr:DMT family transporter [Roseibium sp.]MCV0428202.1 DMT family transporter [Roseibium sp.]